MGRNFNDEEFNYCEKCGSLFINFCVKCYQQGAYERTVNLMEKHGLTEDNMIRILTEHVVNDGNFSALSFAINLRGMKGGQKAAETSAEPTEFNEAKQRIASVIASIVKRKGSE
mgnify:FL=1